ARRWPDDSHGDSEDDDWKHEDSENDRRRCGKFIITTSRGEIFRARPARRGGSYGSEIEIRHGKSWRLHSHDHDRARLAARFRALRGRLGRLRPAALRSDL